MLQRWQEIQIARQLLPPAGSDSSSDEEQRRPLVKRRRPSTEEVQTFMSAIKEVRMKVDAVNGEANKLESLIVQTISSTSTKEIERVELSAQEISKEARVNVKEVKTQVKQLIEEQEKKVAENAKKYQTVQIKFIKNSVDRAVKKYLSVQGRLRAEVQSRKQQLVKNAANVSDQEARKLVAAGVTAEQAQTQRFTSETDQAIFDETLRDACAMEIAMAEVHTLLVDLAALVETQGEQLDSIEAEVNSARTYAVKTGEKLQSALKRDRRKMRTWIWCITIALLILVIYFVVQTIKKHLEQAATPE